MTALPHVMRSHLQFGAVLDNAVIRLEMQKSSLKLNNIFVTVLRGADCLEPCWSLDLDYCGVVLAAGSAELTPEHRRVVRAGVLGRGRGTPVSPACGGGAAGWSRGAGAAEENPATAALPPCESRLQMQVYSGCELCSAETGLPKAFVSISSVLVKYAKRCLRSPFSLLPEKERAKS